MLYHVLIVRVLSASFMKNLVTLLIVSVRAVEFGWLRRMQQLVNKSKNRQGFFIAHVQGPMHRFIQKDEIAHDFNNLSGQTGEAYLFH